jgi:ankyrin repeat domain-containing protein 50
LDLSFNTEARLLDPHNDIFEILGSLVTVSSKGSSVGNLDHNTYISDDDSDYFSDTEIRLAHLSIKNFLVSERIQCGKTKIFSVTDIGANAFIAKSCLLYIFHYDKSDAKIIFSDDLECFPLLQYACQFWYIHAKSTLVESRKWIDFED